MRIFELTLIGLAIAAFGYRNAQEIGTKYRHVI